MSERAKNQFLYATLIDLGFDAENPEILLELGVRKPVEWDAIDAEGGVMCKRLDFVLTVDHTAVAGEPVRIHFAYERIVKDHGVHGDAHVYVLGLRPTRDKDGRDNDRVALQTAVSEAQNVRGRSWCADIGEIRISWRHAAELVINLPNGAFLPEAAEAERPVATDDEVRRMCDALDAFCDEMGRPEPEVIPLDERDLMVLGSEELDPGFEELDLDRAIVEPMPRLACA